MDRPDLAYENWLKSIDIDLGERPRASEGIHFANVGGMWQEIVFGFGGMVSALGTEILTFKPCMPKEIERISFQILWKGQRTEVTVTQNTLTLNNLSEKEIVFNVHGKHVTASPNSEETITY